MSDDYTRLRRWFIDKLKQSRWAQRQGEDVAELAKRIGVQPALLLAAQAELDEERALAGKRPVALGEHHRPGNVASKPGRMGQVAVKRLELSFPEPVYLDWRQLCALRGLPPAVMLRSLVHTLLTGPRNPTWTGGWWMYRGRRLTVAASPHYRQTGTKWPYVCKTDVTHGATAALTRRADAAGSTMTGLLRGQVIDLLEGRLRRVTVVTSTSGMFDDEKKYWT